MTLIKTKTLLSIVRSFRQASYAKIRACLQFVDRYRSETKRIILVKNVIQQTNQYVFISFQDGINSQIVYKMLLLYILWLQKRREPMKGKPGRNFQNVCFIVTLAPLGSKATSTLFHIATRQLCQNIKACSRNIGLSHSSVQ